MSSATILRFPFGGLVEESAPAPETVTWFAAWVPSAVRVEADACPHHDLCTKRSCTGRCQPPPDAA